MMWQPPLPGLGPSPAEQRVSSAARRLRSPSEHYEYGETAHPPISPNQFALHGMEAQSRYPTVARLLTEGYTFHGRRDIDEENYDDRSAIYARHTEPGKMNDAPVFTGVGTLEWTNDSPESGEIKWVRTNEEHRRKGVAQGMLELGRSGMFGAAAEHSRERTTLGNEWAHAMQQRRLGTVPDDF